MFFPYRPECRLLYGSYPLDPLMATMPRDHGFPIQTIVVDDVEEDCIDDCIDVDITSAFVVDVLRL